MQSRVCKKVQDIINTRKREETKQPKSEPVSRGWVRWGGVLGSGGREAGDQLILTIQTLGCSCPDGNTRHVSFTRKEPHVKQLQ